MSAWPQHASLSDLNSACQTQPTHTCFPKSKGRYLYLIMCLICRLIVMPTSTSQYISRIGQNTGMSRKGKSVAVRPMRNALEDIILHRERVMSGCALHVALRLRHTGQQLEQAEQHGI